MMHLEKPKIIISLPLVWSIRNFILSGITEELSKKYEIFYAVDHPSRSLLINYGIPESHIIPVKYGKKISILFDLLKVSFLKRNVELSYISQIMQDAGIIVRKRSSWGNVRFKLISFLSNIFKNKHLFRFIEGLWFRVAGSFIDKTFRERILDLNPDYILSTTFVVGIEWPLILVANRYEIPIFTHVLSFDNITSRGYLPISRFDKYMVWNNGMKNELIHYYNINPDRIEITGTPQFDFHNSDTYRMSRTEGLKMLGLDEKVRFLLYCANHVHHTPKEPELLLALLEAINQDNEINDYKIIVRLHPLDKYERWKSIQSLYTNQIIIIEPWSHPDPENNAIGIVTPNDMQVFVNQLRFADVVLNIASTISIDAAMIDTPVVCIGFHPKDPLESECYRKYHFSIHYKTIMESKAAPLALNMDDLLEMIKENIYKPSLNQENRNLLASHYMENYRTGASDLITKILLQ